MEASSKEKMLEKEYDDASSPPRIRSKYHQPANPNVTPKQNPSDGRCPRAEDAYAATKRHKSLVVHVDGMAPRHFSFS